MAKRNGCAYLESSPAAHKARLHAVVACVNVLRDYQDFLARVDSEIESDGRCCAPREALADRAYEAETAMRVLTRHGLDAMNELRDTGRLGRDANAWLKSHDDHKELDLAEALKACQEDARQVSDGIDLSFLEAGPAVLAERGLAAVVRRGRIELSGRSVDGGLRKVTIQFEPSHGSIARISTSHFFASDRGAARWATAIPVYSPETCHHRELVLGKAKAPFVDAYAGVLSGMAAANQIMYRHARNIEEFGRGGLRGQDPVTAIVGAIICVIGIVLIVVGAATGNMGLVGFGIVVVIGGVCVAVGLCTLVVALLIAVAA